MKKVTETYYCDFCKKEFRVKYDSANENDQKIRLEVMPEEWQNSEEYLTREWYDACENCFQTFRQAYFDTEHTQDNKSGDFIFRVTLKKLIDCFVFEKGKLD